MKIVRFFLFLYIVHDESYVRRKKYLRSGNIKIQSVVYYLWMYYICARDSGDGIRN